MLSNPSDDQSQQCALATCIGLPLQIKLQHAIANLYEGLFEPVCCETSTFKLFSKDKPCVSTHPIAPKPFADCLL